MYFYYNHPLCDFSSKKVEFSILTYFSSKKKKNETNKVMSFIIHLVAFFCYVKKYLNTQHTIFLNNKNNKKEAKLLFFSHTQTRTLHSNENFEYVTMYSFTCCTQCLFSKIKTNDQSVPLRLAKLRETMMSAKTVNCVDLNVLDSNKNDQK